MYVILNAGRYVARAGSGSSFTRSLEAARKFATREAAIGEACGNETVRSVSDILSGSG
jgi:hypothetical protein